MDNKLKRTPAVYLTGFMGSGKSTIGRLLADHLGWDFIDLDREIEVAENATVQDIFSTRGEAEFRRLETETLRQWTRKVDRGHPAVIALGGGAFVHPGNFKILENHGVSLWLDCPFELILRRLETEADSRPLARDKTALRSLYDARLPGYARADYRIDASHPPAHALAEILALPVWK